MNESIWPVLIKADDMTYGPNQNAWSRLVRLGLETGAHVDIGFILKRHSDEASREGVRQWIRQVGGRGFSFFNHGADHTREEFSTPGADYQRVFAELREQELATFGEPLRGFGAPFNVHCDAAVAEYQRMDPQAFVYYPDIGEGRYAGDWLHAVSFDYHVSFERKEADYNPVFDYFRRSHAKRMDARQPMVLQIHPARWSDAGFEEFRLILQLLRRRGASMVTPQEFMALTAVREERRAPPAPAAAPSRGATTVEQQMREAVSHLDGWFVSRYEPVELDRTLRVIERVLGTSEFTGGDAVLDFGCGVGDWLYLLAKRFGFRTLYGVEPNADIARGAQAALPHVPGTEWQVFVTRVGEPLGELKPVALTVCNRALTYMRVTDYLRAIEAVQNDRTMHFIGYQTIHFYWRSFAAALKRGESDLARRRAAVLGSSMEFMAGLPDGGTREHFMSVSDLCSAMASAGFELVRQAPVDAESPDSATVDGLLFSRRSPRESKPAVKVASVGLARELRERGATVELLAQAPELAEAMRALKQRDAVKALTHLPEQRCTHDQPALVVARALALFAAGRLGDCAAWMNGHRRLVF